MLAAATETRKSWPDHLEDTVTAYNKCKHRITGYSPAVVLYSGICNSLEKVPERYRSTLETQLRKYDSWTSMGLIVQADVKVYLLDFIFSPRHQARLVAAAEKSKKESRKGRNPANIEEGKGCLLLAPGDPAEKRNVLKARHDKQGGT